MALYTCPHCATEFETAGYPNPEDLTCFNCNEKAARPGAGYDRMQGVDEPLEPQTWYTVDEAARYLRLPREVIYMLIQQGHLIAYKVTGRGNERFARRDLDAMMRIVETSGEKVVDRRAVMFASADLADDWDNELDAIYDFYDLDQAR